MAPLPAPPPGSGSLLRDPYELFHALQDATGSYTCGAGDPDAWFWEATAEWATGEVFPGEPEYARLIGAFAMHPHLPLNFFDYPDSGAFIETYQYGAFLFPRFLSEQVLSPGAIRDAWVEPGDADEPLDALATLLRADGEALLPTVARSHAHIATWDFDDGPLYEDLVDDWADLFPTEDFQVASELRGSQADGDVHSPEALLLPGHLGASIVRLSAPGCSTLTVRFDGEDGGSLGSTARWAGVLALHGEPPSYSDLDPGREETVFLDGDSDQVDLIIVPESASGWVEGERFGLTYSLTLEPAGADDPDCTPPSTGAGGGVDLPASSDGFSPLPGRGCGCSSGGATSGSLWLVTVLLMWGRRR
ncbi:MAG: hypothetical protein ACI8S6_000476 [Myxococcota bacterium]|jgi:hypothetical protein